MTHARAKDATRARHVKSKAKKAAKRKVVQKSVTRNESFKQSPPRIPPHLAMTVEEFCDAYRIRRDLFYGLLRQGRGPPTMKLGRRRLVTYAAAEAWQCEREREAADTAVKLQAKQEELTA